MTTAYGPADLPLIEQTYLGVLATGMTPAKLAGDPTLRMDYITAVCLAIVEGSPRETYVLGDGPDITPAFNEALTEAVLALDEKGIISAGTPPADVLGGPDVMRPKAPKVIDFDQHPRLWDRFLAQQCMELLFSNPAVYPFLMGKYQDSAEHWGRLYQNGYGRWR